MKRLLIFLIGLLISSNLLAQRNVIWVHGINSGAGFWNEYAADFQAQRQIRSDNQTHVSLNGVAGMAVDVRDGTRGRAGNRTIGIGHSMGGLALREMDQNVARGHVGGVITVGSPLNGSRIINAWQNGEVNGYISHAINELEKGPKRQFFITYAIVNTGLRVFTGRDLGEIVQDAALDGVPIVLLEGASPNDMREGSGYMNRARNYTTNTPRISIYGNENSPVHFRVASTAAGEPDDHFPSIIRTARGVYNAFYIKNAATPFNIINIFRATAWKAGRDFLDNESEKGWNNLIGATRTESVRSCVTELICDYGYYYGTCSEIGQSDPAAGQRCRDACWQETCRTYTTRYNQPSDGILHESTQLGQSTRATRSNWNPNATFEAVGANHNEYDQHPGTEARLNRIFDGLDNVPTFFVTP